MRERRINTRVKGLELQLLEQSGLSNGQVVRYGIKKYFEEAPLTVEAQVLTEISFLQDLILETELKLESYQSNLEKKLEEYREIQVDKDNRVYQYIVDNVYGYYLEFLDDDGLTDEFRSDLNNFYSYKRDAITIVGLHCNKSFDEVIVIFERYLDKLLCEGTVGEDITV